MIRSDNGKVGDIYVNTVFDTKTYDKNIKKILSNTENAFSNTFSKVEKTIAATLSIAAIANFTKSCIDLGSDLAEVQNVVDVVFPSINNQVNNFSKNAIGQFGLSELATKKYIGTFGAMSKSFGFAEKSAFEMSKTVTGLVGDVSSFYNISQELAYTKLKSIWTGETESLKDLGIVMTQTALNEYALKNGFSKTIDKMSEAEKVSLRYAFVQEQLSSATGDFARTSDSWANQVRVLSLRFDQLKASLGQGFINLFAPIVKLLNVVISKLQVFADSFNNITSALFGKQQSISSVSTQYDELGSSAVTSANDLANASKIAKKAVMGYDKLNILSSPKSDNSDSNVSSSVSSSTVAPIISTPEITDSISPQVQKIVDKILSYLEPLKNINLDNLLKSLGNLKDSLGSFGGTLFSGLEWLYFNILVPLAEWTIEDVLPKFIDILSGAFKVLNPIVQSFGDIFQPIWDNLLKPLANWTGGIVADILNSIAEVLSKIGDWMSSHQNIIDAVVTSLLAFFGVWETAKLLEYLDYLHKTGGVIEGLKKSLKDITKINFKDKITALKDTLSHAKDFLTVIKDTTLELGKSVIQWGIEKGAKIASTAATVAHTVATNAAAAATWLFNAAVKALTSPITLVIGAIALLGTGVCLLIKHWDEVKEAASKCWEWIVGVWNNASEWFNNTIVQPIGQFFTGMWDGLKNGASEAWNGIKEIFSPVADFFGNIFSEAWKKVKNVFSTGGKVFDGIKDGIVTAFKNIVNTLIRGINKVVAVPFNAINGMLNTISDIDLPIVGKPFTFIGHDPIGVPQIPQLAEGAWFKARNPRLAIIGEGKENEVVAPESKLDDAIERGFKKYGSNIKNQRQEIVLKIQYEDGREIVYKLNDLFEKDGYVSLNI